MTQSPFLFLAYAEAVLLRLFFTDTLLGRFPLTENGNHRQSHFSLIKSVFIHDGKPERKL